MRAMILGGAVCRDGDVAALQAMDPGPWDVIAVNDAGTVWPGTLHHWASLHAPRFYRVEEGVGPWVEQRAANGHPPALQLWGHAKADPDQVTKLKPKWHGGSSALFAVEVALHVGYAKVVLCGCPLDNSENSFRPGKGWYPFASHRHPWAQNLKHLTAVRSMSGWTADNLGRPEDEWLRS